jgi:hypothetical protein
VGTLSQTRAQNTMNAAAEYNIAVTYAVAALADMSRGDHAAGERFGEAVMTAAAWRGDLDVRAVLDDVLARFGEHLATELAPLLESVSPERAEAADHALADTMAEVRAAVAGAFPG